MNFCLNKVLVIACFSTHFNVIIYFKKLKNFIVNLTKKLSATAKKYNTKKILSFIRSKRPLTVTKILNKKYSKSKYSDFY